MVEQAILMRMAAWDMYAAGVLSMAMHPGTTRDKQRPMTIEEIAQLADQLLEERDKRFTNPCDLLLTSKQTD
jgi:hypothetical protein